MNSHEATNLATEIDCRRQPQKPSTVIAHLCEKVTSEVHQAQLPVRALHVPELVALRVVVQIKPKT